MAEEEITPEDSVETPETPEEETPSPEETPTDSPSEQPEEEAETPQEETLYELPDGRKVTGDELTKEWKENFLPDYTRKAQKIAEYEGKDKPSEPEKKVENPWEDPNWVPQTAAELLEAAKASVFKEMETKAEAEKQQKEQVNQYVEQQLTEIKKLEPSIDTNRLFQHANKYKFTDLMAAYENMKDTNLLVKTTEQKTIKNLKTREADPVAIKTDKSPKSDEVDYNPNESPLEALARIKS